MKGFENSSEEIKILNNSEFYSALLYNRPAATKAMYVYFISLTSWKKYPQWIMAHLKLLVYYILIYNIK